MAAADPGRVARDLPATVVEVAAAAAEGRMNQFDQLRLQVRGLLARVTALEAARPARRKRAAAPRPDDSVTAAREQLWSRYVILHAQFGRGRLTKLNFATRHGLNPTEFGRWLSPTDARGITEGSKPDRSHRRALNDAISELEARKNQSSDRTLNSHGNVFPSQDSRPHVH